MAQTAVEWLTEQFENIVELYPSEWKKINNAIEQAKEMEKQQIIDAYVARDVNVVESMIDHGFMCIRPEEYYSKTFKSE